MKMKKLAAIALAMTMSVSMLASCGDDASSAADVTEAPADSVAETTTAPEESAPEETTAAEESAADDSSATDESAADDSSAAEAETHTFSEFDESKLIQGAIEYPNGKMRLELFNKYGAGTAADKPFDPDEIDFDGGIAVTFDIEGITDQEKTYDAYLMYADSGWAWSGMNINDANVGAAHIKGDGTYTVYLTTEILSSANPNFKKKVDADGKVVEDSYEEAGTSPFSADVFCVDIYGLAADEGMTVEDGEDGKKVFNNNNVKISNVKVEWWDKGAEPDFVQPVDTSIELVDESKYPVATPEE